MSCAKKKASTAFYQVYGKDDQFLGSAECSNITSNASSAHLKLYDENGELVGSIIGEFWTWKPAKFTFNTDIFKGAAILSNTKTEFDMLDDSGKVMVQLHRNIIANEVDHWEIHSLKGSEVSEFILKIFAAFVCDMHGQFIEDN